MPKVLGLFDRAYVINRDEDIERMKLTEDRLKKVGISFQRFQAKRFTDRGNHLTVGSRGVNASHLTIVQEANQQNLANFLIMEDDVIFRDNFCELWSQIQPHLKVLKYDIFYGYDWRNKNGNSQYIKIQPIKNTPCTHFWAIQSCFYKAFIDTFLRNESALQPKFSDQLFTSDIARIYVPTYNLVGQDQGTSTTMENTSRDVRWFRGDSSKRLK